MASPLIMQALHKVDQVLYRLEQLHQSIARTRLLVNGSSDDGCQDFCNKSLCNYGNPRKRRTSNGISVDGEHLDSALLLDPSRKKNQNSPAVNWRQWSGPAEIVHQALSDIMLAAAFAKEVVNVVKDDQKKDFSAFEILANSLSKDNPDVERCEGGTEKINWEGAEEVSNPKTTPHIFKVVVPRTKHLSMYNDPTNTETHVFKVVAPTEDGNCEAKSSLPKHEPSEDESFISANEQKGNVLPGRNCTREEEIELGAGQPKYHMKATEIKLIKKHWMLSQKSAISGKGVMFPNPAFSPSSPASCFNSTRICTPSKVSKIVSSGRKLGRNIVLSSSLGRKRVSPTKSLPAFIDRLPSRRKNAPASKFSSTISVCKSEVLPPPPAHHFRPEKMVKGIAKKEAFYNRAGKPTISNNVSDNLKQGRIRKQRKECLGINGGNRKEKIGAKGSKLHSKCSPLFRRHCNAEDNPSQRRSRSISPRCWGGGDGDDGDKENLIPKNSGLKRSFSVGNVLAGIQTLV